MSSLYKVSSRLSTLLSLVFKLLNKPKNPKDTIFHKIISREIPADILYEDDLVIAFNDVNPVAPLHVLIVPKKTIQTADDIQYEDEKIIGHMVRVGKLVAKEKGLHKGYRLVMNCGEDGGQTVYQLHLHLIGGRGLTWPPG